MTVLIGDYTDLITSLYRDKPKYKAWIEANITPYVNLQNLLFTMQETYFDVNTAIGEQLDIIGARVGASRVLPFDPTGGLSPLLGDTDYRFLIKAKILQNVWKGTNQEIYDNWAVLFTDVFISLKDFQDMSIGVLIIGDLTDIQEQMVTNDMIIPKAQGVGMTYSFTTPPIFAYNQNTDYFKGYDEGNWILFT